MKTIFRVNAAPGFEQAVEDRLANHIGVVWTLREKHRSFDLLVGVVAEDAARMQVIENELRRASGLIGIERVHRPSRRMARRVQEHAARRRGLA